MRIKIKKSDIGSGRTTYFNPLTSAVRRELNGIALVFLVEPSDDTPDVILLHHQYNEKTKVYKVKDFEDRRWIADIMRGTIKNSDGRTISLFRI